MKFTCTLTGTSPNFVTVYVDEDMNLIHAPVEADANDTLHLENGILSVETEENEYRLNGNVLGVIRHRLNGSVTAEAWVYTAAPEKLVEFKYDSNGLRTQKKVTDHGQVVVTDYLYHGKKLVSLTCGDDTLHFFYDAQDRFAKIKYGEQVYDYVCNLQGDITRVIDASGRCNVEYKYNVWGEDFRSVASQMNVMGNLNPFRYRGYIYDEETGLYWIKNRYYCPEFHRFLNADILLGVDERLFYHNSFSYAINNPVVLGDSAGYLTAYILYDSRENTSDGTTGGFVDQAEHYRWMLEGQGYEVIMLGYTNISDKDTGFIAQWNSMEEEFDRLVILGHGAPGSIDARGERLIGTPTLDTHYAFTNLDKKSISYVELYTCNGATPDEHGNSAAGGLMSRITGKAIIRALYYAKTYWLFNKWLFAKPDEDRRNDDSIFWIAPFFETIYS